MENQATSNARKFAKVLRREMTEGERLLWRKLRSEQLGFKFRRQHPVGSYVADFACRTPLPVVEIDGSQHVDQAVYDAKRYMYFKRHGFEVMRFPANLPFIDVPSIVAAIYNRLIELTALAPIEAFPQRGKELKPASELPLPLMGEGRDGGLPESLI